MSRNNSTKSSSNSEAVIRRERNVRSQRISAVSTSRRNSESVSDSDDVVSGRYNSSSKYIVKNHNHEFSAATSSENDHMCQSHSHIVKGTTGPAMKSGNSHVHQIEVYTDTFDQHFHGICETTGPAIYLANGKHIHRIKGETTMDNQHDHDFYFVTQVQDPSDVPDQSIC